MTRVLRARLGEVLVAHDLITVDTLLEALHRQEGEKRPLGEILIEMGVLTQDQLNWALSEQLGIPYVELSDEMVDLEAARAFPEELLRRHQALPILKIGDELTVALADPTNEQAVAELRALAQANVTVAIASASSIAQLLARAFPPTETPERLRYCEICPPGYDQPEVLTRDASGVALLYSILLSAVREKATEIHIEPLDAEVRVRHRLMGGLQERARFPIEVARPIASRLRVLAGLQEAGGWQKSHLRSRLEGRDLELEILFLPTRKGEAITILLWCRDLVPPDLEGLGISAQGRKKLDQLLRNGSGLFLVSSRDPAGRAAGLYALALAAASKERQIVAIERVSAFEVPSMLQVETDERFDTAAIELLSHPPEVVLVEDVSSGPVCLAAARAAERGCLVVGGLPVASPSAAWEHLLSLDLPLPLFATSVRALLALRREGDHWTTDVFGVSPPAKRRLLRDSIPWTLPTT